MGDKITDLYSTAKQIKELEQAGYEVVYNGFDPKGATKYFEKDQKTVATFTVAVEKIKKVDAKEENKAETNPKKESTQVDGQNEQDHKVLKHIFPWMK